MTQQIGDPSAMRAIHERERHNAYTLARAFREASADASIRALCADARIRGYRDGQNGAPFDPAFRDHKVAWYRYSRAYLLGTRRPCR